MYQLARERIDLQSKLGELQALVMKLLGERNMLHSYPTASTAPTPTTPTTSPNTPSPAKRRRRSKNHSHNTNTDGASNVVLF